MNRTDPWQAALRELGLLEGSSWQEIQARYRRLVLTFHPDVNRGNGPSAERFRAIAAAYERLKELKREREAGTVEHLQAVAADPRLAALSVSELGMRVRYSSSASVRATSAFLLGKIASQESRRLLVIAYNDKEPEVRRIALDALARVGGPSDFLRCLGGPASRSRGDTRSLLVLFARAVARAVARRMRIHTARRGSQASSFAWGR